MPLIKRTAKTQHPRHAELVAELVRHLRDEPNLPQMPKILQEEDRRSSTLQAYVVWAEWDGIDERERSEIILDAYLEACGKAEMLRITVAMGVTPLEAKQLGLTF
jgi:hypothetical protein